MFLSIRKNSRREKSLFKSLNKKITSQKEVFSAREKFLNGRNISQSFSVREKFLKASQGEKNFSKGEVSQGDKIYSNFLSRRRVSSAFLEKSFSTGVKFICKRKDS